MAGKRRSRPDDPRDDAADPAAKTRRRGDGPRTEQQGGLSGPPEYQARSLVLAEKDGLYLRVVGRAVPRGVCDPRADDRARQTEALADSFRAAFNDVWGRVPGPDRVTLLAHWREGRSSQVSADRFPPPYPAPAHCPEIRLVDLGAESAKYPLLDGLGCVLHFPAEQTAGRVWPSLIPLALAEAYRYATREHGRLVDELFEGPMDEWEGRQGKKAGEARREEKAAAQEKKFLRVHNREVARLLARWGFGRPPAPEGPRRTGGRGNRKQ